MIGAPLVSVIVIFYNAAEFLGEALESVFAQTFDDWEMLLVDDGSNDGSSQMAQRCAAQHPEHVRYLEHSCHINRGMSATRNLGIRHARGKYLALLDADDIWLPPKLEQQVALLNAHGEAALVYGVTKYWFSWASNQSNATEDYEPALGVSPNTIIAPPLLLTLCLESKAPTPCPSDILIRRNVVESVGGFEEDFVGSKQLFEDQAFLAKVYLRYPTYVSNQSWFYYRQHTGSCMASNVKQKYSAGLYYFAWLENYLREHQVTDARLWQALSNQCWRYRHPHLAAGQRHVRQYLSRLIEVAKGIARWLLPRAAYQRLKGFMNTRSSQGAQ